MRRVTDELVTAVGADNAIYHEFHAGGWGVLHATAPVEVWEALPLRGAPTDELRQLHPGVEVMCAHRGYRPFALTDLVSERQWSEYAFRDLLRPTCGTTLTLHIGVHSPPGVARGWSLTRNGSDYSRADLEVAEALQPVLDVVVARYAAARQVEQQALQVLTGRELAVLRCLAEGLTAAAVGRRLTISARTVHKHVEHVHRKLRVCDRVSALNAAARLGLLGPTVPAARGPLPDGALARPGAVPSSPFAAPQF